MELLKTQLDGRHLIQINAIFTYIHTYSNVFGIYRYTKIQQRLIAKSSWYGLCFSFSFLFFFFCKQQIAFQWHDCCSSLLLVRCVCSDKTNVHMLYTISNTYFAFLPSNLAFIEDQRREICWKIRILAMATTKLALFHIFWYSFWTDSTDNNHLHLHVCIYVSYRLYNF